MMLTKGVYHSNKTMFSSSSVSEAGNFKDLSRQLRETLVFFLHSPPAVEAVGSSPFHHIPYTNHMTKGENRHKEALRQINRAFIATMHLQHKLVAGARTELELGLRLKLELWLG